MRLQRQQWRQTKRQLLQTGMLDLPASAKAAGRRARRGAAAADLTDTDSEAEDELDSDQPEGEDSSALTEAFRDAAPKGALLGVLLRGGLTCTHSMRLQRGPRPSQRFSAMRRLHLHWTAGRWVGGQPAKGSSSESRMMCPQVGARHGMGRLLPPGQLCHLRLAEAFGSAAPAVAFTSGRVQTNC